MLNSIFAIKLLIDALALFAAGTFFSLLLLRTKAYLARSLSAYVPSFAGSLLLIASAAVIVIEGVSVSFTLPSTFSFIPYAVRADLLGALFLFIIGTVGAVSSIYGLSYSRHYDHEYNTAYLGALFNVFLASMALVVVADGALFFLVSWELMSLVSYLLIVFEHKKDENIRSGLFYFIMMQIGAAAIAGALFLLSRHFQTTSFDAWRLAKEGVPPLLANVVFILALVGFGTKAGMMPLHTWLPRAHPAAPAHVSSLMSGVMIKTALLLLVRFTFEFLPTPDWWWGPLLVLVGAASAVLGILEGSAQTDLKRLLAFSSIENIGLMTIALGASVTFLSFGLSTLAVLPLVALFFHAVNHSLFKALLFLSAGTVVSRYGTANMEMLGGAIKRLPKAAIAFFIGSLAVAAFPPLSGFASEWMIFQTVITGLAMPAFYQKAIFLTALTALALASGITILAFAKAFGSTFLARPRGEEHPADLHDASRWETFAFAILAIAILSFGVFSKLAISIIERVAKSVGAVSAEPDLSSGLHLPSLDLVPLAMTIFVTLVFVSLVVRLRTRGNKETVGIAWDCGYPLASNNEISATAFSRTILMILKQLLPTKKISTVTLGETGSPYFPKERIVRLAVVDRYSKWIYEPIEGASEWLGARVKRIQNGNLSAYVLYVLIALIVLVAIYI